MITFDFNSTAYSVCRQAGYSLSEALQHWKTKFETVKHFKRDVINHPGLKEFGEFVEEVWDSIVPLTVQQAFQEMNLEKRRVMFDCIGVSKLFKELNPDLLDKQTITKTRTRWGQNRQPYVYQYEDTYELYKIDGKKLFTVESEWWEPISVYAVRCWCTTTGREYWIYVPEDVSVGGRWSPKTPDAIRAIAWTIRIDVSHPKRIFRQGDIIIVEESDESETVPLYHLNKEQYLQLMFSET
jgi:hypothetical protein